MRSLFNKFSSALRALQRDEGGVSAIEFVFVAPLIFLCLGVTMETGVMMFVEYTLQAAVEDSSRSIRIGAAQTGNLTAAQFKNKICTTFGTSSDCQSRMTVYVRSENNFATLKNAMPALNTIGPMTSTETAPAPACYKPGLPKKPAVIVATYDYYFVTPFMGLAFGNIAGKTGRRLMGVTLFQNQDYPGTSTGSC